MSASFTSGWSTELSAFLAFKRALGYPYKRAELTLRSLDRFLVDQRQGHGHLHQAMLAWLESRPGRKPVSVACELAVVRQFYTYLQRSGCRGLREPAWPQLPATSKYTPHSFSIDDVRRLLHLTGKLGGYPSWVGRPDTRDETGLMRMGHLRRDRRTGFQKAIPPPP